VKAWRRRGLVAGVSLAAVTLAAPAFAQSASDAAAADALFTEAQKLGAAGRYEEACPKYAESLRLDSGIGVMLYLADCWERTGKTASAWAQFREAEELARRQGDKRADAAHKRAALLEPGLARLTIHLAPGAEIAGLDLARDKTTMGRAQWGVPVPVDPGLHTIVASAPGKKTRVASVLVTAGGAPTVFEIAPLEDQVAGAEAPATEPLPSTAPEPGSGAPPAADGGKPSGTGRRTLSIVVGGAGLAGIAVGAFFGFDTISKNNASNNQHCDATNHCDGQGLKLRKEAMSSATASNIAFIAGGALLAGGVVLYLTVPRASSSSPTVGVGPVQDGRGGAVFFSRAW
jgi:hypothetical protein